MNNSKNNIQWRRKKVAELLSKCYDQRRISTTLQVSQPTVSRDIKYLVKQSKQTIDQYAESLAFQYTISIDGIDNTINELWKDIEDPNSSDRLRQNAKGLLIHAYRQRNEVLASIEPLRHIIKNLTKKKNEPTQQISKVPIDN
jgi:hypothetical protein